MSEVVYALLILVILISTPVVIPYIKNKFTAQQLATIEMWVKIAVAAAEQAPGLKDLVGVDKKDYVMKFLQKLGFKISDEQLDNLIEATVYAIKKATGKDGEGNV